MTVKAILATKGHAVTTIEPAASLADAAKLLSERRIGAVIVTGADGAVAGLLSERDIVHTLARHGAAALAMTVESVMTRKVVTSVEADTIQHIMERMTAAKFRHMPIVEDGRLVGIISIGDVVKYRIEEVEREAGAMRDYILTA